MPHSESRPKLPNLRTANQRHLFTLLQTVVLIHGLALTQLLIACDVPSSNDSSRSKVVPKSGSAKELKTNETRFGSDTADGASPYDSFPGGPETSVETLMKRYLPDAQTRPIGPKDLIRAAKKALDDKDYDAAEMFGDQLVTLSPDSVDGYIWRGRARSLSLRGKDDEAIADLTKAISMGTNGNGRPYEAMARIMDSRGDRKKALSYLDDAVRVDPKEHDYLKYRAALRADLGDLPGARSDYDKAIEVKESAACYFQRGRFHEAQKEFDEALKDYATAIEVEKKLGQVDKTAVCHQFRIELLTKLGRHKEAVEECSRALRRDRNDEFLRIRGKEYAALKMYREAERDLTESIEIAPNISPDAYEARASIYKLQGKTDLAKNDLNTAKALRDKPAERPLYQ